MRIQAPELAALPWEFLYDPLEAEYLSLSRFSPIVRYVELPRAPSPIEVSLPLNVLGVVASPSDLLDLDVERERSRLEESLRPLGGLVRLQWLEGQTWRDLQRAMRAGPWHVFHFIGHGDYRRVG